MKIQCDLVDAWFIGVCGSQQSTQYNIKVHEFFKCTLSFPGIPFANRVLRHNKTAKSSHSDKAEHLNCHFFHILSNGGQ